MNEEIKEILDMFTKYKDDWFSCKYILKPKQCVILFDYITNLQKENKILKENAIHNDKVVDKAKWNEMIYKSRINKALDYIKIEFCQINEETKELECWHKRVEPILDILNGKEYKEEE